MGVVWVRWRSGSGWRRLGLVLFVLVALSMLVRLGRHDQFTIDTKFVIDGSHQVLECLGDGNFRSCGYEPGDRWSHVQPYPLLQYVPTIVLVAVRFSDSTVRDLLGFANATAVIAATALVVRYAARRGGARLGFLAFVAMASGMLVPYAGATFGEPLATLAIVTACVLAVRRRPSVWLAPTTFLAVIGKETFLPVVVLYLAGLLLLSGAGRPQTVRKAQLMGIGAALGFVANLGFNVFRYGEMGNVQYLETARPAPSAAAKSFGSLLLSPNGGLAWFWFMGFAAVAVLAVTLVRGLTRRDRRDRGEAQRLLGIATILAGFVVGTVSLSLWWTPFGWYSWGPRLMMPLVPPVFVAAATVLPPLRAAAWKASVAVMAVAGVLLVPNYAVAFAPERFMTHWVATVDEEPQCWEYDVRLHEGVAEFHRCVMRAAWRTSSMPLLESVRGATDDDPWWYWGTVAAAITGGILFVHTLRQRRIAERASESRRSSARQLGPDPRRPRAGSASR